MNQSAKVIVRPAESEFFEDWRRLYQGYAGFYKVPMNEDIENTVWGWIMNQDHEVEGFLAFLEGQDRPCGLAHVRRMPSPLRGTEIGFLDDLYVDPAARGNQAGKALFAALRDHARQKDWNKIRWITADDNYRARSLYDNLSSKTMWNTYEMEI